MKGKNAPVRSSISEILNDPIKTKKIIQRGIHAAVSKHKLLGNPVCEWRDGAVVWIQPEDIVIKDDGVPDQD